MLSDHIILALPPKNLVVDLSLEGRVEAKTLPSNVWQHMLSLNDIRVLAAFGEKLIIRKLRGCFSFKSKILLGSGESLATWLWL